jgi:hypothetical protein
MFERLAATACMTGVLLFGSSAAVRALDFSDSGNQHLQVKWGTDSPRNGWRTICGRVFNDRHVAAWHVRLRVDGIDESGRVVNSEVREVVGDLPSEGSLLFCLLAPDGAATYRVSVVGADWMISTGQ